MAEDIDDMSVFELALGNRTYASKIDDDLFTEMWYLKDRIFDLKDLKTFRKEMADGIDSSVQELLEIEAYAQQFLKMIQEKLRPERAEKDTILRAMRKDDVTIDELERRLAKVMAEIADRLRLIRDRARIDNLTKAAPWRERALKHQLEGAHRMVAARRSIMGDKPGLGKTLQAIMAINMLREQKKCKRALIITLKPVLKGFEREIEQWYPGQFVWVLNQTRKGDKGNMLDIIATLPEAIVITNYEVWRKDKSIKQKLIDCQFDTIVLDEAHVLADQKSFTSRYVKEIVYAVNQCNRCGAHVKEDDKAEGKYGFRYQMCPQCEARPVKFGDFRSVKNVFPMTGTPLLNKPHDLFPLLNLIDPDAFPLLSRFLDDYCERKYVNDKLTWTFRDGGPDRLLASLGMKFTQRTRDSAGVEMPPQDIVHHELELDPELYPRQHAFINMLRDNAQIAFADGKKLTSTETFQWYTWMRQSAIWPDAIKIYDRRKDPVTGEEIGTGELLWPKTADDLPGESIVMNEAEGVTLEAVNDGDRVIVASAFKTALKEMERRLQDKGIRVARLDGDANERSRRIMIDDFDASVTKNGEHQFDVLLVQYRTGSTGLNLHNANQIVLLDREWNPGKEEQMLDRVRRIGSKYASIVHMFHCAGTATDLMDALQELKKVVIVDGFEAQAGLFEAMRAFLGGGDK